eukprot:UN07297
MKLKCEVCGCLKEERMENVFGDNEGMSAVQLSGNKRLWNVQCDALWQMFYFLELENQRNGLILSCRQRKSEIERQFVGTRRVVISTKLTTKRFNSIYCLIG